jgi:hypothetical protein
MMIYFSMFCIKSAGNKVGSISRKGCLCIYQTMHHIGSCCLYIQGKSKTAFTWDTNYEYYFLSDRPSLRRKALKKQEAQVQVQLLGILLFFGLPHKVPPPRMPTKSVYVLVLPDSTYLRLKEPA